MDKPVSICLVGYGKMGKLIHSIIENRSDCTVSYILRSKENNNGEGFETEAFLKSDIVIDFSHPDAILSNINAYLRVNKPAVIGTTGWNQHVDEVKSKTNEQNGKILFGSNFSLGVQLFNKLVSKSAELFGNSHLFDASLHEVHHKQKADSPSGTALTLAESFVNQSSIKSKISVDIPHHEKVNPELFYVSSQRLGTIFGEHELRINSEWDDIRISHRALNRNGFAAGAVQSALWLLNQKKSGFYFIEDVIEQLIAF